MGGYNGSGVAVNGGKRQRRGGNDIYDIGSHGISHRRRRPQDAHPAGNYADNNYIHHTGVFYKQGVGIASTAWATGPRTT